MKQDDRPEFACKQYWTAVAYSERHGCKLEAGGRHVKVVLGGLVLSLPAHSGDYPKGTAHAILRSWRLMGIACLVVALVVVGLSV